MTRSKSRARSVDLEMGVIGKGGYIVKLLDGYTVTLSIQAKTSNQLQSFNLGCQIKHFVLNKGGTFQNYPNQFNKFLYTTSISSTERSVVKCVEICWKPALPNFSRFSGFFQ